MPSQSEIEYMKKKHQGFTSHKLKWSIIIGISTNVLTMPFEMLKIRAQVLQEGRLVHGKDTYRAVPMVRSFYEVIDSGAGIRGLYKGLDTMITRSFVQSATRTFLWCNIMNILNKDPRSKCLIN